MTSWQSLAALGHRVDLAPLTPREAVDLVQQVLCAGGTRDERVSAEAEAAERLAEMCGYLPLALERAVATSERPGSAYMLGEPSCSGP
ncbi:hypothetical protein [Streptomyces sp. 1222.5]|uniref:hypothetical protein n=1 Tax=Streptomyces sp. 1222.5 TaxID=1881026 RepID=UPI003EBE9074